MEFQFKEKYDVKDLVEIVRILRSPEGCPWDKVQTHQTIRQDFIEEVYEAVEAIDEEDTEHLKEELGDVLLQVVFHSVLEEEKGNFNLDDTADDVCKKMNQLNVKNLVLWHTVDDNIETRKQRFLAEGKDFFDGNLYVPDDLDVIDLD